MTQITSLYEAPSPSEMAGMATETMVESTKIMKKPSIIDQRAGHGERVEVCCTGEMILRFNDSAREELELWPHSVTGNRKGPGMGHRSRAESVRCYTPSVSCGSLSASAFVSWRVPGSCSGGA